MTSLAPGATLCDGRYRLDTVLGRGGMAIVWRASDVQLERDVAIKVISDVLATDPRFVARFQREARLAAGLSHPNLVKVFDFSVDGGRPFLIMEYIPGGTLAEARGRGLDADVLARDLLDAVAHIHAAGILHRDIKPGNVLLGADGSPRLTDFGIARSDETTALTQTGQVLGTLRYIAPEVAAGEPASVQSDLYSLGVLLREVGGDHADEPLRSLLARLTAPDPRDRPRSAADALADLDPTRALTPTEATQPLRGQPPCGGVSYARSRRVRRAHAIAAAALLLALLVVVIVVAAGGGGTKRAAPPANVVRPAPAGAPVAQQLDRLEQIVRAARKR